MSAARSDPTTAASPGGRTPQGFCEPTAVASASALWSSPPSSPTSPWELRLREAEQIVVTDLFVELDRTFKSAKNIDKFERYDQMISGWCMANSRTATPSTALPLPLVVFVCRDQANAKEFCRAADPVVGAAHAYGGEYASEWCYPG